MGVVTKTCLLLLSRLRFDSRAESRALSSQKHEHSKLIRNVYLAGPAWPSVKSFFEDSLSTCDSKNLRKVSSRPEISGWAVQLSKIMQISRRWHLFELPVEFSDPRCEQFLCHPGLFVRFVVGWQRRFDDLLSKASYHETKWYCVCYLRSDDQLFDLIALAYVRNGGKVV